MLDFCLAAGQGCGKQPRKEAEEQENISDTVSSSGRHLSKQQISNKADEECSPEWVCEPLSFFIPLSGSQAAQIQAAFSSE